MKIFVGAKVFSIDYSGAKYARFPPKIAAMQESLFEWLKTAISSNACGTVTLKSLLPQAFAVSNVHPRPRKRLARCTLDCGFKTSESPAVRGFVGGLRALATASLYLVLKSNGLHHPENLPVKFGFSPKNVPANIAKKLPPQRCSKPLLIALFNLSHKRPTFAFSPEIGTLGFWRKIAHSSSHGETGVFHPSVTVWFVLPVKLSPKEQPEKADARLMACVRFLQHRGPARLRYSIIFAINYVSCAKGCFLRAGPRRNHKRPA